MSKYFILFLLLFVGSSSANAQSIARIDHLSSLPLELENLDPVPEIEEEPVAEADLMLEEDPMIEEDLTLEDAVVEEDPAVTEELAPAPESPQILPEVPVPPKPRKQSVNVSLDENGNMTIDDRPVAGQAQDTKDELEGTDAIDEDVLDEMKVDPREDLQNSPLREYDIKSDLQNSPLRKFDIKNDIRESPLLKYELRHSGKEATKAVEKTRVFKPYPKKGITENFEKGKTWPVPSQEHSEQQAEKDWPAPTPAESLPKSEPDTKKDLLD